MLYSVTGFQDNHSDPYSMQYFLNTYMAFVEAIIPWSPELAEEYGEIQYYGAIDSFTYEYLILSLFQLGGASLVRSTAEILDVAAKELVYRGGNEYTFNVASEVAFSALTPTDRLSALQIMKEQEISLFHADIYDVDRLIGLTMMGYYSEWFGYGSTRLEEPSQRVMEFRPISWEQVGYPGPRRN